MSALIFAAWIAAAVGRLAAALRRLADSLAPLTEEAPRQASAPAPTPTAEQRARFEDINARMVKRYEAAVEAAAHLRAGERTVCALFIDGDVERVVDDVDATTCPVCLKFAPRPVAPPPADVADPRQLASAIADALEAANDFRGTIERYRSGQLGPANASYYTLGLLPAELRARVERYRAAPAIKLHYVRSYREALCGAAYPGSRCTGDPQRWHAEPPATRCPTCAAELRRADPHRFDTLRGHCPTCLRDADDIAGPTCAERGFHAGKDLPHPWRVTDTSGDADELLSREPPFAGRGGSL